MTCCPVCGGDATLDGVVLLADRNLVLVGSSAIVLSTHEFCILEKLACAYPRVVSKPAMMDHLYSLDSDAEPDIKIVDVYVCKVRKKLRATPLQIETMWGKGYALNQSARLIGAVE